MKSLMGQASNSNVELQVLANSTCDGNVELLTDRINEFLVFVSSNLPRLVSDHPVFNVQGVLPAEYTISVITTENALQRIKINKAMGRTIYPHAF